MANIKKIFWNAAERRIRAAWRLSIQVILFLVGLIGLALAIKPIRRGTAADLVAPAFYLVLTGAQIWLLARFIDRRPVADYGFHLGRKWWLDLAFGAVLGAALITGVFATEYCAGWVIVKPAGDASVLGPALAFVVSLYVYAAIAFSEEFIFRGYELRNLAEGLSGRVIPRSLATLIAWLFTSSIFGIAHALNPNATLMASLNIVLAGLLLGLPYVLTGELAISIGMHWTWNLFQGTVCGFPVSGSAPSRRLLLTEQTGPEFWTGGKFGPEGGLLAAVWVLLGCGMVAVWIRFQHKRLALCDSVANYKPAVSEDQRLSPGKDDNPPGVGVPST